MATTEERMAELEKASAERKYNERRESAGFDDPADFDTWALLEKLRRLTLTERSATDTSTPSKRGGSLVVTGYLDDF